MEPKNLNQENPEVVQTNSLLQVTRLSKYLAMALFVLLPFVGGYIGYTFAPEKVVEIEKVVVKEVGPQIEAALDKVQTATTTIDMGQYRVRYGQRVLQLINDRSEILQEIPVNFFELAGFTDEDSLVISNRDINYDHYLDVGVLNSIGYGGVNRFYHFYVYDPVAKQLVLEESLGLNEGAVSNPTLTVPERTITSSMRSGQQWVYETYEFADGVYQSVATWTEDWE